MIKEILKRDKEIMEEIEEIVQPLRKSTGKEKGLPHRLWM
jgi:hypothetical protein